MYLMSKHFDTHLMSDIISSHNISVASKKVYDKQKKYHHNNDVWFLSSKWPLCKKQIQTILCNNTYTLEPVVVRRINNEYISMWSALYSVVLTAISQTLTEKYNYHLKGGGVKKAAQLVTEYSAANKFVAKADIKSFYASIDHNILLKKCTKLINNKKILNIIKQDAERLKIYNGEYKNSAIGIFKGCPLSTLMGAIILTLDQKNVLK